jgi:hypothetical protein
LQSENTRLQSLSAEPNGSVEILREELNSKEQENEELRREISILKLQV